MATINEGRTDAAASTSTTYTMAVGDSFFGDLDNRTDNDWIRIELERGETYEITLSGRGAAPGKAEDTILKIYDDRGRHIITNDDIDTAGRIFDSKLVFEAPASGVYYLSASSYAGNPNRDLSGTYTLTVRLAKDDSTTPEPPGNGDNGDDGDNGDNGGGSGPAITGTNRGETLTGTDRGEIISGRGGSDRLNGRGGDDRLDGGSGSDTLNGGAGGDELIGGDGVDTASYEDSPAGVEVRLHVPRASGGHAQGDTFERLVEATYLDKNNDRITVQVPDIIHLIGSGEDDILAGDIRANILRGGDGNDTLFGGPGGDTANNDDLYGDAGDDRLFGGRGRDELYGGDDDDVLRGGPDNDDLYGEDGDDELYGGDDVDELYGGRGDDELYGEAGRDELRGGEGDDELDGGADDDELYGEDDDDNLVGGPGRDELFGGSGDDTLEGGAGDDDLNGGEGEDIFKFAPGDEDDVIEDFVPGEDRIDLSSFTSIDDFDDLELIDRRANTEIELPGGGELILEEVAISDLDADDFIFRGGSGGGGGGNGGDDNGDDNGNGGGGGGNGGGGGAPIAGDPDPDRLHGTPRDDNLDGKGGNDVLYGVRGNDVLTGGADVDSYEGGPGDDIIVVDYDDFTDGKAAPNTGDRVVVPGVFDGGPGNDTLSFADFRDVDGDGDGVTVAVTDGAVTYKTGSTLTGLYRSIENFIGSPFVDTITGADDSPSIIEGGDRGDTLTGGTGAGDTVSYRSSPSSVTIDFSQAAAADRARKAHAAGDILEGFENIIGSAYNDILIGNEAANVIEGLAGADTLDGGAGADTLSYASSNAAVTIDLNRGTGDFDATNNTIKTASGGHAAGDKVKYGSFANVLGSRHGDRITGNDEANTLTGGAGNDTLNGENGDDVLDGGPGGDTLNGGDDTDTVTYAGATESVTINLSSVSERNDVVTISNSGGRGDAGGDRFIDVEKFIGSGHDDTFIAGPEADDVDGGDGTDTISYERSRKPVELTLPAGGGGATAIPAGDLHGNVTDTNGNVRKENYAQGDILNNFENIIGSNVSSRSALADDSGDMIHDKLTGNGVANVIDGRGGDDKIAGGGGADTLIGGSGNDMLTGGGDSDTFVISGRDEISDFTVGDTGDKLSFGSSPRTLNLNYKLESNELVITSGGHQVTFTSLTTLDGINGFTAANFIFDPDGYVRLTDNSATDVATRGNYRILGSAGDNRLTGGSKNDDIDGGAGDETINGGNGDDNIDGGAGDDTIEGGAGADTLAGGDGDNDTLSYAGSSRGTTTGDTPNPRSGVTVTLSSVGASPANIGTHAAGDTISGGFENLIGSRYDDQLTGGATGFVKGGSGNDWLISGGGTNRVEGGPGKDRLDGSAGGFLSYEGSGSRVTVNLGDTSDITLNAADALLFGVTTDPATVSGVIKVSGGDATGDIATGFQNVIGGRSSDTLTGNGEANELRGMNGNDTLTGGAGADILKGGAGNDTLKGGAGDDMLDGGPGADKLEGGGTEAVPGTDTATYASATAGVTVDLSGGNRGAGDARGDSFDGIEQYVGSSHADIFIAGDDAENINGGPATEDPNDTVSYARSDESVTVDLGSTSAQTSTGYASGDTLANIENVIGSNRGDTLTAGTTGSVITGGRGDDTLAGAGGSDTFVFASGDGDDEINTFTIADDKIDLSAFTSIASLEDLKDEISDRGGDIEIDLPGNGEIRLNAPTGFEADHAGGFFGLTADNFIFYTKPTSGVLGDRFNNEINGGRGDEAIYGENGRDILNGGAGNDEIYGGEDNDTINGGEGDDWLDGGPGNDTFIFEPGHGNDIIMDWEAGDKIDLSAFKNEAGAALISEAPPDEDTTDSHYTIDLTEHGGGMITILDTTTLGSDPFILS